MRKTVQTVSLGVPLAWHRLEIVLSLDKNTPASSNSWMRGLGLIPMVELSAGHLHSQESFVRNPDDTFEIKQKTFLVPRFHLRPWEQVGSTWISCFAYSALENPLNDLFTKIKHFSLFFALFYSHKFYKSFILRYYLILLHVWPNFTDNAISLFFILYI